MAIKIQNSTIIDDGRNIVNSGITTVSSLSIDNNQVISSARQLQNIASLDATTKQAIEESITDLNVTGIATFTSIRSSSINNTGITTTATLNATTGSITNLSGTNINASGIVTATNFFRGTTPLITGVGIGSTTINPGSGTITNRIGFGFTDISLVGGGVSVTGYGSTIVVDFTGISKTRTVNTFTATEAQTTFNVSYVPGFVDVYLNGVFLTGTEFTATNGTSVILAVGANAGDILNIITYQSLSAGPAVFPQTLNFVIDGGGSTITTGNKGVLVIDCNYTVTGWTIIGNQSGSIVVDVKRASYSNFPTTSSISGTEKPTLSSSQKNEDLSLTTWTTSLSARDILEFVVDSVSNLTRVTVGLRVVPR